jgi:hypothetical protein
MTAVASPNPAVRLISALSYHGITLSIPLAVYRFDSKTFNRELETHPVGSMPLKIYSAAQRGGLPQVQEQTGIGRCARGLRLARQRKRVQNK